MGNLSEIEIKREDIRQIRQEYLDERRLYIQAEHKAVSGFARALLTLSAGALGFSLTFMRTAIEEPEYTGWLFATWVLFALSLLIITAALYSSHLAFREGRSILRANYEATKQDYLQNFGKPPEDHVVTKADTTNKAAEDTEHYNRLAFSCFIGGSVTLIIFVSLNFF